jgi:hypothetical protein
MNFWLFNTSSHYQGKCLIAYDEGESGLISQWKIPSVIWSLSLEKLCNSLLDLIANQYAFCFNQIKLWRYQIYCNILSMVWD